MLAQLAYMKKQYDTTAAYLEKVIEMDPLHPQANPNLVLVYMQMGQKEKAKKLFDGMKKKGMQIPDGLETLVDKNK